MTAPDDAASRRRAVAIAGHNGDRAIATAAVDDSDPSVRATALGALERLGILDDATLVGAFDDAHVTVRRRAAELAATHPEVDLVPLLHDDDPSVIEVAAWSCGEHESDRSAVVERLIELADHHEPLVRESCVAALGAIGDPRSVETICRAATSDKPAVRRRAVLALAPFDGEQVEAALRAALDDRDWQVRQNAEDLTGQSS
ncbi:MAG: HEAT repeat domain-containing protein [Actinomycetota bacterium]